MSNQIHDINRYMRDVGRRARDASRVLAAASTAEKNSALLTIADDIDRARAALSQEGRKDSEQTRGAVAGPDVRQMAAACAVPLGRAP